MLVPRHCQGAKITSCQFALNSLRSLCRSDAQNSRLPVFIPVRYATHGAAGKANGPKNGPGKRLGAKKTGDERVVAGNIIFRQRGTNWYPGENCGIGRDHTIFAREGGFVKYYRDPHINPKRRYIGVVFDKSQTLPSPPNAARKRRLGMVAVPRLDLARKQRLEDAVGDSEVRTIAPGVRDTVVTSDIGTILSAELARSGQISEVQTATNITKRQKREAQLRKASGRVRDSELEMRPGYMYRETNYQIGQAAERAGVEAKEFVRRDRFLAWRRRNARKVKNAEKRAMGGKKGSRKGAKKK